MNRIFKMFLAGLALPCMSAMGMPHKWSSAKFKREAPEPLKFGDDGKFRILHITDIHDVEPEMDDDENREIPESRDKETINVIEKLVEKTNPDLVAFGGDNISGYWEEFTYDLVKSTIQKITAPIRKRNIPLCVVFGNHDGEEGFHTEFQLMQYMEYHNCRSNLNDADVYGCGNCCVTIKNSSGDKDAFAIWLIDSNDYQRNSQGGLSYDCVHDDQIEWYEKRAAELKDANCGKPLPAILFQHMPVQQMCDGLKEVTADDDYTFFRDGKHFKFGHDIIEGRIRECPCPPYLENNHRNQFESWKKTGDIIAAFFGHDHVNDFHIKIDGINLYQTLGAGYFTYGNERGGRLIILDENNPENIYSESIEIERITATEI
ncbi:MAG: metallophosphoesterase family protein [Clostridia bacterium]|nr:metallophosphoesterase family protein [Clostridia bacterium]